MNPPHIVVGTRRSWTGAEKQAILAEAQATTTSVSAVARRHGLSSSLLFRWRRGALDRDRAEASAGLPAFIPLALPAPSEMASSSRRAGGIEIELAGGHRIRADAEVDPDCCGA